MMVGVVVVAAGSGTRLGLGYNKVYMDLLGKPVLAHSLLVFEEMPEVNEIIVVTGQGDLRLCKSRVIEPYRITKTARVVSGGYDRQESVWNGLRCLSEGCDTILVHDGARPCITADGVLKLLEAVGKSGAAALGIPVKDTLKSVDDEMNIERTVERRGLWAVHTPQGFRRDILMESYKKAREDGFRGTDECGLAERLGYEVKMVQGSSENIKLTTSEDIMVLSDVIRRRSSGGMGTSMQRIGFGYDVHRLVRGRPLFIGGVEFDTEYGLDGHSDADVLLHAISDALLGAAALGDIGVHFPPGDPKYAGISSLTLLGKVRDILYNSGYRPINIDATVIAEKPKIMPKALEMRKRISECLTLGINNVSIKATTNEGLGSIGAGEGISAHAVCMVERV